MNFKIVDEEYKIYFLCYSNDYIIDFKFNNIIEKIIELRKYLEFSQSKVIILDLIKSLLTRFPHSRSFYVLHLNNFFTTYKLYQRLYELEIGVNDTVKTGSGISKELTYLRETMTKQNDHEE